MKTKDQFIGIRLDEQSLARLDSLAAKLNLNRSATMRRLLMYVDKDCGSLGESSAFVRWSRKIDAMPFF